MATAIQCNRCKEFAPNPNDAMIRSYLEPSAKRNLPAGWKRVFIIVYPDNPEEIAKEQEYDLCSICKESHDEWMLGKN